MHKKGEEGEAREAENGGESKEREKDIRYPWKSPIQRKLRKSQSQISSLRHNVAIYTRKLWNVVILDNISWLWSTFNIEIQENYEIF